LNDDLSRCLLKSPDIQLTLYIGIPLTAFKLLDFKSFPEPFDFNILFSLAALVHDDYQVLKESI